MAVCPGKIRLNGLVDIAEDGTWVENPKHPLYYLMRDGKDRPAALPAVRHRTQYLLHPAALGAPPVSAPDVRAGRGSSH